MLQDFLCTFDSVCKSNVEFIELANETLFKVLDKSPHMFLTITNEEHFDDIAILQEIENPILDFNLQKIYDGINNNIVVPSMYKRRFLDALIKASIKEGTKITEPHKY